MNAEEHNRRQRAYFEGVRKRTMETRDTPYVNRQVDELVRLAGIRPGDRVLEVGCGMGRYTLPLAARSIRVEGLDLSDVLLDRLRAASTGLYDIPLFCADILDPPDRVGGDYDAVIGFFTLHHLHDLGASFAAIKRLLRPQGRLAFLEPNAYNPLFYLQIAVTPGMTWKGDRGIVNMRPGLVMPAMMGAGLEAMETRKFGFFPPFVVNRPLGSSLERLLERIPLWRPLLPFQVFRGRNP